SRSTALCGCIVWPWRGPPIRANITRFGRSFATTVPFGTTQLRDRERHGDCDDLVHVIECRERVAGIALTSFRITTRSIESWPRMNPWSLASFEAVPSPARLTTGS